MRKIIIDGKKIITNYGESGAMTLVTGDDLPNYELYTKRNKETDEEFFNRLVSYGFTRIRFAEVATFIKGFHDTVAYCR